MTVPGFMHSRRRFNVLYVPSVCCSHFWHKIISSLDKGSLSPTIIPDIISKSTVSFPEDLTELNAFFSIFTILLFKILLLILLTSKSLLICLVSVLYFSQFCRISLPRRSVRNIPFRELPGM